MAKKKIYSLTLLFCISFFLDGCMSKPYSINKVVYGKSVSGIENEWEDKVSGSKLFLESLINQYINTIRIEVNPKFSNELKLLKNGKISGRLLLSGFAESVLYIYPAKENVLYVDFTDIPAQMSLLHGLVDINDFSKGVKDNITSFTNKKEEVERYLKTRTKVKIISRARIYGDANSNLLLNNMYKFLTFKGPGIILFYCPTWIVNTQKIYPQEPDKIIIKPDGPILITEDDNFFGFIDDADFLGKSIAEKDIKDLITTSSFFRQAKAHKKLSTIAKEIIAKRTKSWETSYEYPMWEFNKDISLLIKAAENEGVDTNYAKELINDPSLSLQTGTLLWYYQKPYSFATQWTLINLFILFLCAAPIFFLRKNPLIAHKIIYGLDLIQSRISLPLLVIFINGYVFKQKPTDLSFYYCIIPGILFMVIIFALLFLIPPSNSV